MNIYEDYANYISECQELIEEMIQYNSSVYYAIADVLKVTDYIYQKNEKKERKNKPVFSRRNKQGDAF